MTRQPSGFLLGAQFVAMVLIPYLEDVKHGRVAISVVSFLIVMLALFTVRTTPALTRLAVLIGLPALVFEVWSAVDPDNTGIFIAAHTLLAIFYLYTAYGLIAYVFADHWVTKDELFAVGAAFTVLAWAFAYIYLVVQTIYPGSFVAFQGEGQRTFHELLYLSVANITSVRLSDVTPVVAQARSVAMIEQILGVLYVAMVISRLVALTVMRRG